MLSIKNIQHIRSLYFDDGYTAYDIAKKVRCSPNTVYRYINMTDFSPKPAKKRIVPSKLEPYIPVIKQWLEEDRNLHRKQRHTALRVQERLQEEYPEYNLSYGTLNYHFQKLRKEIFHHKSNYLPLTHIPGEAQVDFGMCSFYENDILFKGYYLVVSFPYSNASFCQLTKAKNAECMLQSLKNIFHYIGGSPHTDWFDNDSAIVKLERNKEITKSIHELFSRFQMHYDFHEVFLSPQSPNEKGNAPSAVKFLRNKLFVPIPYFDNIQDYNKILLDKCTVLLNRKHYKKKDLISDLWMDDKAALCPLPIMPFDVSTIRKRKCDSMGRVTTENHKFNYYLGPAYAYKTFNLDKHVMRWNFWMFMVAQY